MYCKIFLLVFLLQSCTPSEGTDATNFYKTVGSQIRKERLERGLSQQDLADSVNITQNSLSLIEDGLATPIHTKLIDIQNFLDVKFEINDKYADIEDYLKENKLN